MDKDDCSSPLENGAKDKSDMTMSPSGWTDADTDAMFAAIGRYLVIFQWVESKLDQILLLGWGHENSAESQVMLAKKTCFEKINDVETLILNSPDFARVHTRPEWCVHFKRLIERLHEERTRRNALVHSSYLFEFADAGLAPPLRSVRVKAGGVKRFDQEYMSKDVQQELLQRLVILAFDVNLIHVQIVHDYQAVLPASPSTD